MIQEIIEIIVVLINFLKFISFQWITQNFFLSLVTTIIEIFFSKLSFVLTYYILTFIKEMVFKG